MALCLVADSRIACLTRFSELRGRMLLDLGSALISGARSGKQFGTRRQPGAISLRAALWPVLPCKHYIAGLPAPLVRLSQPSACGSRSDRTVIGMTPAWWAPPA